MENNFEKQVQQKMDELSLTPSAPVWNGVAAAIARKRDRRRVLLWLLPLLLLGGGIGYILIDQNNSAEVVAIGKTYPSQKNNRTDRPVREPQAKPSNLPSNKEKLTQGAAPKNSAVKLKDLGPGVLETAQADDFIVQNNRAAPDKSRKEPATKLAATTNVPEKNEVAINENKGNKMVAGVKQVAASDRRLSNTEGLTSPADSLTRAKKDTATYKRKKLFPDSLAVVAAEAALPDTAAMTAQPIPMIKKELFRKWSWGITARVGFSNSSGFRFDSSKSAASTRDVTQAGPTAAAGTQQHPAQPATGLAYSIAVQAKRSLTTSITITGGLRYSYYSTRLAVGSRRHDSVAVPNNFSMPMGSAYYRNDGRHNEHTNRFHFIELPLGIEYRPMKKIPLQLLHGLSIGRLFSTTNLRYNPSANIYVASSEAIIKTQLHGYAAAQYRLFQTNQLSLHAGPQLQYGIHKMFRDEEGRRLFFAGLQMQVNF